MSRSTHQGNPAAPYLFLLCSQVLLEQIKENSQRQRIEVNDLKDLVSQFADDTQLFIKNTVDNLEQVIRKLTQLEENLGLTVNYEKSSIHTLGNSNIITCEKPLVWDPGGLTILGIPVQCENPDVHYRLQLDEIKSVVSKWSNQTLSLMSKVLLVNSSMALFVYPLHVLCGPCDAIVGEFNNIIANFLWNSGRPKIPIPMLKGLWWTGLSQSK